MTQKDMEKKYVYGSFNDAVSSSDYIELREKKYRTDSSCLHHELVILTVFHGFPQFLQ
jgi:hypothetical protein